MPFALIIIGLLVVVAGARDKTGQLGALLANDFTGQNSFLYWLVGIGGVGAVGYYAPAKDVSRLFIVLIVLAMMLSDKGFFAKLLDAIQNAKPSAPAGETATGSSSADPGAGVTGTATNPAPPPDTPVEEKAMKAAHPPSMFNGILPDFFTKPSGETIGQAMGSPNVTNPFPNPGDFEKYMWNNLGNPFGLGQ